MEDSKRRGRNTTGKLRIKKEEIRKTVYNLEFNSYLSIVSLNFTFFTLNYLMISIIAVIGKNRAIGKNNQLLWHIPEDMQHFKEKTMGKTVVMGDRTFLSIGKPLPGRKNVVVTLDSAFKVAPYAGRRRADGVEISHSLDDILQKAKKSPSEIFIIGGGQIYAKSLPHADKLYLTIVDDSHNDADTYFPDFSGFSREVRREEHDNGEYKFTFLELTK